MINPQQLLVTRITIVMIRENYHFLTPLNDYEKQLKKYFKEDYGQDEIEAALHQLEEAHISKQLDENNVIEVEEDI